MTLAMNSRYRALGVIQAPGTDGVLRPTVPILRHERSAPAATLYRHRVTGLEDLEYLAWRFSASSEDWWRIADANPLAFPLDLRPGNALNLPHNEQSRPLRDRGRTF
jgi:hypothetical protein